MNPFIEKLTTLWPEMVMLVGAVACLATGLSGSASLRAKTPWVAGATMVLAWIVAIICGTSESHPLGFAGMVSFVKYLTLAMGLILLLVNAGVPEALLQSRASEKAKAFEPGDAVRGEFYAFFLLSLTGVMLTAGATDLVWLFLALELTSLPTYVMIATTRDRIAAQESAVKYFFLGAMSAAVFLYGFALIYGATGFTEFAGIAKAAGEMTAAGDGVLWSAPGGALLIMGIVIAILGLCYKIAAVPMHVYAADVYEGAATPVTAFLAFVPKTAGFAALILIVALVGWDPLPTPIAYLLAGIAILTMTVGNVLGYIQTKIKRVLAYSSIAQSGYLLTGLVAGLGTPGEALGNGPAAILFYLLAYGTGTVGAFAVLACVASKRDGREPDPEGADITYDDLSGLWWKHPVLGGIMLVSMLSLVGMPPLAGFVGKVYLIGGVFTAGYVALAVMIVLNSAISAGYYLRIAMVCFFGSPSKDSAFLTTPWRTTGALITVAAAFALGGYAASGIVESSYNAVTPPPDHHLSLEDADAPTSVDAQTPTHAVSATATTGH